MIFAWLVASAASASIYCIQVNSSNPNTYCEKVKTKYSKSTNDFAWTWMAPEVFKTYNFTDLNQNPLLSTLILAVEGNTALSIEKLQPLAGRVNLTLYSEAAENSVDFSWTSIGSKVNFLTLDCGTTKAQLPTLQIQGIIFTSLWTAGTHGLDVTKVPYVEIPEAQLASFHFAAATKFQTLAISEVSSTSLTLAADKKLTLPGDGSPQVTAEHFILSPTTDLALTGQWTTGQVTVLALQQGSFTFNLQAITQFGGLITIVAGESTTLTVSMKSDAQNPTVSVVGQSVSFTGPTTMTFSEPMVIKGAFQFPADSTITLQNVTMESGGSISTGTAARTLAGQLNLINVMVRSGSGNTITGATIQSLTVAVQASVTLTGTTVKKVTFDYLSYGSSSPALVTLDSAEKAPPAVDLVIRDTAETLEPLQLFSLQTGNFDAAWGNVLNSHDKYTSYIATVNGKQVVYASPRGDDLPLSIGAIVGIAVSALVVVILIIVLGVLACRKQRKDKPSEEKPKKEKKKESKKDKETSSSLADL